ncbi:glutamate--tRNA ligase [Mycoplasmopsis lipofaciens]|uniref:glutamate--tRNA ligase n=1 Tax=Mycoplasmopsis lipofaciens TaxID=114884 RepID=UPI0004852CCA|nr:glutamate--tRNA ligase [Mycoplasmopsis lipofaciens]
MNNKKIRTRYAPSPTGYLHIGGARTALFCYLYAKHFGGDFVFRLEDTDIKRNVVGGEESQLQNLEWLGIIPDECPQKPNKKHGKYRQSEKLERYKEIANQLIEKGLAYKAYDTSEELEKQHEESNKKGVASFRYNKNFLQITDEEKKRRDKLGQYSIRFNMKNNKQYSWNDIVRGNISFNSNEIGDWVIIKSDGYPTYNFAVVVDDHDMEITHVLRGEEHITNTPKQLAIYDALNWEPPKFGHLTIITNMEGKKLSKRDTNTKQFIEDYRNDGYSPEAIFNFLALLGWSTKDENEILSREKLIEEFDPNRLSKSPSKFDIQKMQWFSKQYIKNTPTQDIIKKLNFNNDEWTKVFVDTFKESVFTLENLKIIKNEYENPIHDINFNFTDDELLVIKEFKKQLEKSNFTIEAIQSAINITKEITKKSGKKLFHPIRLATTFKESGPELAKSIYLFGKDVTFERLNKWK